MDQIGLNKTEMDKMDRMGPMQTEWTEYDQMDRIGPNGTEWTKLGRSTQHKYKRNTFVVVKFGLKIKYIK